MSDEVHVVIESLGATISTLEDAIEQLKKASGQAESIPIQGDADLVAAIEHNRSEVLDRINEATSRLESVMEALDEIMADTQAKKQAEADLK